MEDISEHQYFRWIESAFNVYSQDLTKKNNLYHHLVDIIKANSPQDSAMAILALLEQEMNEIRITLAAKTADSSYGDPVGKGKKQ